MLLITYSDSSRHCNGHMLFVKDVLKPSTVAKTLAQRLNLIKTKILTGLTEAFSEDLGKLVRLCWAQIKYL